MGTIFLVIIVIIMNKSPKTTVFHGAPEIDFHYELKTRKVVVDFEFDALLQVSLHREPPEVGLVKKLTGSLY